MEDERESVDFKVNLANIELALRILRDEKTIDETTYFDFMIEARRATTIDQLRKLGHRLARVTKIKKPMNY
jgi:hypothetical protein